MPGCFLVLPHYTFTSTCNISHGSRQSSKLCQGMPMFSPAALPPLQPVSSKTKCCLPQQHAALPAFSPLPVSAEQPVAYRSNTLCIACTSLLPPVYAKHSFARHSNMLCMFTTTTVSNTTCCLPQQHAVHCLALHYYHQCKQHNLLPPQATSCITCRPSAGAFPCSALLHFHDHNQCEAQQVLSATATSCALPAGQVCGAS